MNHSLIFSAALALMLGAAPLYAAEEAASPAPATQEQAAEAEKPAEASEGAENAQALRLPLDDQMRRAKENYDAAVKDLTPEQKAELEALDAEFASTMEIDMQILYRSAEMEHCLTHDNFFKADQKNIKSFVDWRQEMLKIQEKRQNEHKMKRIKLKYIKPFILDRYYVVYQTKMLKMLGLAVTKNAYESGAFAKTDCDDLALRLKQGR